MVKIKILKTSDFNGEKVTDEAICPQCDETAHLIVGGTRLGLRLEQMHCNECHCTFVLANGRFTRFGVLNTEYW